MKGRRDPEAFQRRAFLIAPAWNLLLIVCLGVGGLSADPGALTPAHIPSLAQSLALSLALSLAPSLTSTRVPALFEPGESLQQFGWFSVFLQSP